MKSIIGHNHVRKMLQNWIEEDKVGHAYLFIGREGIGKKLVAMEFANAMMCQNGGIDSETDKMLVIPEKDLIKVEVIRDLIINIYMKPAYANRKVVIIDEADKMNLNAQNALLKVLEEPPLYATIILITSHKEKIIKTILSRVTEVQFQSLTQEELSRIVGKEIDLDFARGSAGKAIALMEGDYYKTACTLQLLIENKDYLQLNRKWNEIKSAEMDMVKVLEILKLIYHKAIKSDTQNSIQKINFIDTTIKELGQNVNTDLSLDKLSIRMCQGA